MSTVAEIKAAAVRLSTDERLELLHWLAERDDVAQRERADLLTDLDAGLAEADRGDLLAGETVFSHLKARAQSPS